MRDATQRFSDRVDDYARYRPGYPTDAVEWLLSVLDHPKVVADVGAGTGISAAALSAAGVSVHAIEPNEPMRTAGIEHLDGNPGVTWWDGTAELTGLDDDSVDAVIAAQAFHWFDPKATAKEWRRITKSPHRVGLVWNQRRDDIDDFSREYENLLARRGTDYPQVDHRRSEARIEAFFPGTTARATFPNKQLMDLDGFRGRAASSSYVPGPEHPDHELFFSELEELFHRHAEDGKVLIRYATNLYVGTL